MATTTEQALAPTPPATKRIHPLIVILPILAFIIVLLLVSVIAVPSVGEQITSSVQRDDLVNLGTLLLIVIIIIIIFIPSVRSRAAPGKESLPNPSATKTAEIVSAPEELKKLKTPATAETKVLDADIIAAPPEVTAPQKPAPVMKRTVDWPRDVSDGVYGDTIIPITKDLTLRLRSLLVDYRELERL